MIRTLSFDSDHMGIGDRASELLVTVSVYSKDPDGHDADYEIDAVEMARTRAPVVLEDLPDAEQQRIHHYAHQLAQECAGLAYQEYLEGRDEWNSDMRDER